MILYVRCPPAERLVTAEDHGSAEGKAPETSTLSSTGPQTSTEPAIIAAYVRYAGCGTSGAQRAGRNGRGASRASSWHFSRRAPTCRGGRAGGRRTGHARGLGT